MTSFSNNWKTDLANYDNGFFRNSQLGYFININSYLYVTIFLFAPIPTGSFFTSWGASIFWLNIGIILAFKKNKNPPKKS